MLFLVSILSGLLKLRGSYKNHLESEAGLLKYSIDGSVHWSTMLQASIFNTY